MIVEKIIKNSAQCLLCGEILVSESKHDFKTCKCGNLSVDGGNDYIRRCWGSDINTVLELSEGEQLKMSNEEYLALGEDESKYPKGTPIEIRKRLSDYLKEC